MKLEVLLTASAASRYSGLCLPRYRGLLEEPEGLASDILAVGYHLLGQPAGLALGEFCAHHQCVHARSLFVAEKYRRRGIGSELLAALGRLAGQRGYPRLDLEYPLNRPATPAVERLLAGGAWSPPEPGKIVCRSDGEDRIEALMRDPWMTQYHLPDEFALFPWAELSDAEFQQIAAQHAASYGQDHLPQRQGLAEVNSLGVRYRGEVVGWMLTKPLGGTRILYENLFIRPGFRSVGRGAVLLAASIQWHYRRDGAALCGIWQTKMTNKPMVAFIKRRLGPYLSEWEETRRCSLFLSVYQEAKSND